MIRFFGQKKVSNTNPNKLIGYEFLLREYVDGRWQLPADFSKFSASEISDLLEKTIDALPPDLPLLSFNLDQAQFIDAQFSASITRVFRTRPVHLYVELTERDNSVEMNELVQAAREYRDSGIRVVLDDVGTGDNQSDMAHALNEFTSEYKFALQNARANQEMAGVGTQLKFWSNLAKRHNKIFAIEGFEYPQDLDLARDYAPDVMQGYYFGKPELIALS